MSADFLLLPPEINSARMFTGAGAAPMRGAATAWQNIATQLESAASSVNEVTAALASDWWQGPAAMAMTATAATYLAWLNATAARAHGAAGQAEVVATTFEAAQAATVRPLAVTANRSQLVSLVRTNLLGQNASTIAATEAEYEQMWAQNIMAMTGYQADVLAAIAPLTPWQRPPHPVTTDSRSVRTP